MGEFFSHKVIQRKSKRVYIERAQLVIFLRGFQLQKQLQDQELLSKVQLWNSLFYSPLLQLSYLVGWFHTMLQPVGGGRWEGAKRKFNVYIRSHTVLNNIHKGYNYTPPTQ